MILMIGASGAVGKPTLRALAAKGAEVRALSSGEDSAAALSKMGASEVMVGDLRSADDLAGAMAGVDTVFFVMPRFQEDEAEGGKRIVDAAQAAGVGHFVYCSVFNPQVRGLDHHARKLDVEEHLIESGLFFTILRPAMFMQNLNMEWRQVSEDGVYPRPYSPDQAMAAIDTDDLGEAAARVLMDPALQGGSFDLCGDRLSHAQMAAILSDLMGREISAEKVDLEDWKMAARARGATDYFVSAYGRMCAHYDSHGLAGGNPLVLRALLGREPNDYRVFAEKFVAAKRA
jgi:uncharacterized protein YbjT (DUF2867 family)